MYYMRLFRLEDRKRNRFSEQSIQSEGNLLLNSLGIPAKSVSASVVCLQKGLLNCFLLIFNFL